MHRTAVAALAVALLPLPGAASAGVVTPAIAALSPYTATRLGHRPRHTRTAHCESKADSVGVQGHARAIYMRKCTSG